MSAKPWGKKDKLREMFDSISFKLRDVENVIYVYHNGEVAFERLSLCAPRHALA